MEMNMAKKKNENSKHYIDNSKFLQSLIDYKKLVNKAKNNDEERPQCPDYIGDCFIKIANHLAYKSNFINYSFREDMILDAIENCLIYMDNFDPKKSSNPFAYFTQITYYAFLRRIQKEKKQLQTKYKYIEFLDLENVIRQAHDEGSYDNGFIKYLKQQADTAQRELSDIKKDKKMTRKPKYLQKLNEEPLVNEADHIDVLQISETTEIGEIEYE
jgi:DNA-directed RNA polymerase specialized sigma24 family protein